MLVTYDREYCLCVLAVRIFQCFYIFCVVKLYLLKTGMHFDKLKDRMMDIYGEMSVCFRHGNITS